MSATITESRMAVDEWLKHSGMFQHGNGSAWWSMDCLSAQHHRHVYLSLTGYGILISVCGPDSLGVKWIWKLDADWNTPADLIIAIIQRALTEARQ